MKTLLLYPMIFCSRFFDASLPRVVDSRCTCRSVALAQGVPRKSVLGVSLACPSTMSPVLPADVKCALYVDDFFIFVVVTNMNVCCRGIERLLVLVREKVAFYFFRSREHRHSDGLAHLAIDAKEKNNRSLAAALCVSVEVFPSNEAASALGLSEFLVLDGCIDEPR